MLIIRNLTLYLLKDLRTLLDDFNFSLEKSQKVALIGEEGNGKSTLLKVIVDEDLVADYVKVTGEINKKGEIIGYLPQVMPDRDLSMTTLDYLNSHINMEEINYSELHKFASSMGFPLELMSSDIFVKNLSGGEKIKFQLLCQMMKHPTLLLLDEPSNDLDIWSVRWLEQFIKDAVIPVVFVSHDEVLLENCANTIIHIEQLIKKTKPFYTIAGQGYADYVSSRESRISRQTKLAQKEREEYEKKMEKYRRIYSSVQYALRTVSRGSPAEAKNLKDKMHSVKAMGRRFEKQKENMTPLPAFEESILVTFDENVTVPKGKVLLDFHLSELKAGDKLLSKDINLFVMGPQKVCIVGANGAGKTTLLKEVLRYLSNQNTIRFGYMPQDYAEEMEPKQSAIEFLTVDGTKEEQTAIRTHLGSMKFTREEMVHPIEELSGGQRAKLYFLRMVLRRPELLLLDEPTRNISPLSGPEIRKALRSFKGGIVAASHDRKFISEVCDQLYLLDQNGLHPLTYEDLEQTMLRGSMTK